MNFYKNVATLPLDATSMFIRSATAVIEVWAGTVHLARWADRTMSRRFRKRSTH
jgi:hypothetical protein